MQARRRDVRHQDRPGIFSGPKILLEFAELLIDKFAGDIVPAKFVIFSLVGSLGVVAHLAVLALLFEGLGVSFPTGQIGATLTAMTSNFALNNVLTYHDRRLSAMAAKAEPR